eukprot:Lankesteria_metandrocarpae@DN5595_c0_g1_i1.p1
MSPLLPRALSRDDKNVVFVVLLSTLLDATAIGILVPVMQLYFIEEVGFTVLEWGYARGIGGIGKLFGALLVCMLSDRWGRKYPLVCTYATSSLLYFVSAFARGSTLLVFLAQCLLGVGGNPRPVCMSIMCDISEPESTNRARLMSITAGCFACGMIVGPGIGGVVAVFYSRSSAVIFAAFFQMSAAMVALLLLRETLPQVPTSFRSFHTSVQSTSSLIHQDRVSSLYGSLGYTETPAVLKSYEDLPPCGVNFHEAPSSRIERTVDEHGTIVSTWNDRSSNRDSIYSIVRRHAAQTLLFTSTSSLRSRGRRFVIFARFMQSFAVQSVTTTYALFIASTFTDRNVTVTLSQVMSGSALILFFSEICLYNIAFKALGPFGTSYLALLLMSCGLLFMRASASISFLAHIFVTCAFYTVGYGISEAALPVAATYFADPGNQGATQGKLTAMHSLGKSLSPVIYTGLYTIAPTSCFYVAAVSAFLSVVPLLISQQTYNDMKRQESKCRGLSNLTVFL